THAAGLTLRNDQLEAFREAFEKQVATTISEASRVPVIYYDINTSLSSISVAFVKKMLQMAPFGPGNQNPVFVSRRVKDTGMAKTYGEHLSMNFFTGEGIVGAMAFFQAQHLDAVKQGKLFDICYHIDW